MPSQTQVSVAKVKGTDKQAVILNTQIFDALEPMTLLRMLKKAVPQEFRQVWYEMDVPEGALVLPDSIETEQKSDTAR